MAPVGGTVAEYGQDAGEETVELPESDAAVYAPGLRDSQQDWRQTPDCGADKGDGTKVTINWDIFQVLIPFFFIYATVDFIFLQHYTFKPEYQNIW